MQLNMQNFVITCLACKGQSRIRILEGQNVMYIDHSPIISCRLRGDMNWGFECQCGNDSRLAREELPEIRTLVQGGEHAIKKLAASLKIKDEKKFRMVEA